MILYQKHIDCSERFAYASLWIEMRQLLKIKHYCHTFMAIDGKQLKILNVSEIRCKRPGKSDL